MANEPEKLNFNTLVNAIGQVHESMATQARRAVNISLTLRNWIVGYYIREYEQSGADRAQYGQNLLGRLSQQLKQDSDIAYHPRELCRCREFYEVYFQIGAVLAPQFGHLLPEGVRISQSCKPKSPIRGTLSPELQVPAERLIKSLSFSHFAELIVVEDPLKRAFYETECIRGHWSVRELKRQIASLYFERSGLSHNKEKLAEIAQAGTEQASPQLMIRDPYVFEFLGIKSKEVMRESDLEDALLDRLEDFLLELGHGFCFEARQKRILIGDTYGFIDLVFYHRILRCHVLVELKIEAFTHENLGQLNTYVSWYRKNEMIEGDSPPVGILLCTRKDQAVVEYALSGMDNNLFVSKYQLELPSKEDIQHFLEARIRELGDVEFS